MSAWIVDGDVVSEARRLAPGRTMVEALPATEVYELHDRNLVWAVVVVDEEGCSAVIEAILRGVDVVVRCDGLSSDLATRFLDDLRRVGGSEAKPPGAVSQLDPDQRALLEALAAGATLSVAAAAQGMAVRSAHRRLSAARSALGVETTAEAVLAVVAKSA